MIQAGTFYTKKELNLMFGDGNVQALKRKLTRYGISHNVSGRGENAIFEILKIEDRFKVFCITELDFYGNTDFKKLRNFYYYFFNDEEFAAMPDEFKERKMTERGKSVSRQTIANYIKKLTSKIWVAYSDSNCKYYFAYKDEQKFTTHEEYSEAWRNYWLDKENGCDCGEAICRMVAHYGGVARKQTVPQLNAFYLDKIKELCDLIQESFEKEIENQVEIK